MSGYKVGGKDLDSIFIPGSGYSTSTKFTVGSGKADLQNRYMNYRLNKYTSATNYKIAGGTDLKDVFEWGGYTPSISSPGASSVSPTKETLRINGNFYKAKVTINGTDYWFGSGSGGSVTDWSNTAATVNVTGLSANTAYNNLTITAYNYFGDSVTSSVSFTTIDIARITSVGVSGTPTTNEIDVSAAGNSSTIYIIVSCSNGSSQRINASSGTVQFTSGLNPGTSYTFTATPYDADGNAGETKQTSISTAKPPAPTVSITKSGTAPSDPTQSIVVSCTVSNGTATVNYSGGTAQSVTADGSAHDYTFTGLTPNTKYTFTVTSTDSYGQSASASTDITTDQAAVLPVITSFTGTPTSSTNITLTIVADANTSYVIIKCTSDPNNVLDATITTNGSTTKFDRSYVGLSAGTPYTFTATPYTSGNVASTTTATLTVTTSAATGGGGGGGGSIIPTGADPVSITNSKGETWNVIYMTSDTTLTFHGTFVYELLFVGPGGNGQNASSTMYQAGGGGGAGSYMSCQYQSTADDVMKFKLGLSSYGSTIQGVALDLNWRNSKISYTTNRIDDYIHAQPGQNGYVTNYSADNRGGNDGELILQTGMSYAPTYRYLSVYASIYEDQFKRMLPSCFSSYEIGTGLYGGVPTTYKAGGGGGGGAGGAGGSTSSLDGGTGGSGKVWKVDDINYCQGGPGGYYNAIPSSVVTKGSGGTGGSIIGGSYGAGTSGQPGMLAIAWKGTTSAAKPTVSILQSGTPTSVQIVVSCTASNGTASVNYSGGTAQTVIADGSAHDYTFTGLTPNTKYTFTVTSTDSYGQTSTASTDITTDQNPLPVIINASIYSQLVYYGTSYHYSTGSASTNLYLNMTSSHVTSVVIACSNNITNTIERLPATIESDSTNGKLFRYGVPSPAPTRKGQRFVAYYSITPYNGTVAGNVFNTNSLAFISDGVGTTL